MTLKLWADQRTDAAQELLLAARGARRAGARPLARDPAPHPRPRGSVPAPGRRRASSTATAPADPEPVRDLQRRAADRRDDRARRPARLPRRSRPATTRGSSTTATGRCSRAAADPAKDQTYMLSGLRPGSLARLRFPLAELTKPEVREIAAAAGLPVASKAESQDLCFLAGEGKRSFLARHGGLAERPGRRSSTAAGGGSVRHRGHHEFTVGQRRGLGVGSPEPLYVLAHRRETNTVTVGLARGARHAARRRAGGDPAPAGRTRRPRPASLPLAAARLPACPASARASTTSLGSSSPSPPTVSPRARPPACSTATWWSAGRRSPSRAPWPPRRRGARGRGRPPPHPRRPPSRSAWLSPLERRPPRRCPGRSSRAARRLRRPRR